MKVLLLNLPSPPRMMVDRDSQGGFGVAHPSTRQSYGGGMNVRPPLFLAYSASILRQNGFEPEIYDALNLDANLNDVLLKVKEEGPDILVVTVSLPSIYGDIALLEKIKTEIPQSLIVATGAVCVTLPNEVLSHNGADIAVGTELEYAILDIAKSVKEGLPLQKVRGIYYKQNEKTISTTPRLFITNLDEVPFPAYDLLPMHQYRRKRGKKLVPFFTTLTSRGCSYSCPYCPYPVGYGNKWRARSVENVIAELKLLTNQYSIKSLIFRDQVLTFDIKRAEKLFDEMISEDFDIEWICETRVDHVNRELLVKMKKAGCVEIRFGVETGEPEMLKTVGKPGATIEDTKTAFKLAREVGIKRAAHVIVGFPGDDWNTIRITAQLLKEIEPDAINVFIMTLYPGTKMYKESVNKGWLITKDWSKYTVHTPVMKTKYLDAKEIEKACEYLFNQFRMTQKMKKMRKQPLYFFMELFKPSNIKGAVNIFSTRLKMRRRKENRNN